MSRRAIPPQDGAAQGDSAGRHVPVMLAEMLDALRPRDGSSYLDGTFGGGGYARAILDSADCAVWAIDRDETAIARGAALAAQYPGRLHLTHGRFGDMVALMAEAGVRALDGIVLDIGVSSFQLNDPERGFSFRTDGPLDMRMGRHGPKGGAEGEADGAPTAAILVNTLPERDLADLLFQLGEERASPRVARATAAARAEAPIETTGRLAGVIRSVLPTDKSGIDPATRSFQALRISVNDELGEIERGLARAATLLNPGGRIVVVSFHSLEDRIVKRFMIEAAGRSPAPSRHDPRGMMPSGPPREMVAREMVAREMAAREMVPREMAGTRAATARFRLVTTKAIRPGAAEVAANPRARSARLRALERVEAA